MKMKNKFYTHIQNICTLLGGGSISRFNLDIRVMNIKHPNGSGAIKRRTNKDLEIKWD